MPVIWICNCTVPINLYFPGERGSWYCNEGVLKESIIPSGKFTAGEGEREQGPYHARYLFKGEHNKGTVWATHRNSSLLIVPVLRGITTLLFAFYSFPPLLLTVALWAPQSESFGLCSLWNHHSCLLQGCPWLVALPEAAPSQQTWHISTHAFQQLTRTAWKPTEN